MILWGHWRCFPVEVPAGFFGRQLSLWPLNTLYCPLQQRLVPDSHAGWFIWMLTCLCLSLSLSQVPLHSPTLHPLFLSFLMSSLVFPPFCLFGLTHWLIQTPVTASYMHGAVVWHQEQLVVHCLAQGHCKHRQEDLESNPVISQQPSLPLYFLLSSQLALYPSILPHLFSDPPFLPPLFLPSTLFFILSSHLVSCSLLSSSQLSFLPPVLSSFLPFVSPILFSFALSILSFLSCCLVSFTLPFSQSCSVLFPSFILPSFLSSPQFFHPLIFSIMATSVLPSLLCSYFLSFYPFLTSSFLPLPFHSPLFPLILSIYPFFIPLFSSFSFYPIPISFLLTCFTSSLPLISPFSFFPSKLASLIASYFLSSSSLFLLCHLFLFPLIIFSPFILFFMSPLYDFSSLSGTFNKLVCTLCAYCVGVHLHQWPTTAINENWVFREMPTDTHTHTTQHTLCSFMYYCSSFKFGLLQLMR